MMHSRPRRLGRRPSFKERSRCSASRFTASPLRCSSSFQAAIPAAAENSITVDKAWSRATAPGVDIGVGYLTIKNNGDTPDRLRFGEHAGRREDRDPSDADGRREDADAARSRRHSHSGQGHGDAGARRLSSDAHGPQGALAEGLDLRRESSPSSMPAPSTSPSTSRAWAPPRPAIRDERDVAGHRARPVRGLCAVGIRRCAVRYDADEAGRRRSRCGSARAHRKTRALGHAVKPRSRASHRPCLARARSAGHGRGENSRRDGRRDP